MMMTAPRHRRHRENIGDFHYPQRSASGAQGRVCLVSMRTFEHICIVIIRFSLTVPRLISPAQIARSYAYVRCSDFQIAISDSDRNFRFQLAISRFRDSAIVFREFANSRIHNFAIPVFRDSMILQFRDFAIPRFRDFT